MAIKKVIEIDVDVLNAQGGIEGLTNTFKETEKQGESLRSELRRLKQQLAELPEGSAEYNKIAQRAGEVSDKISDISARVKNLGSDTKNIDAVVQGTQALSGAFSVATSASALLGSENKDLQETMLKVESAIGLTVGIQSVANALQKETALSIGLSTVATKIQTGAQIVYATVIGTTTGALKALRVALISTGVGALVVGLGFLIAKMSESTEATEDQDEALKALTETQKRYSESLKNEISGIERLTQTRVLKAKIAGKSEKELRDIEKNGEAERATAYDTELKRIDNELKNRKLSAKEFKLLQEERNKIADESLKLAYDRDNAQLDFEVGIADKRRDAKKKLTDEANATKTADREKARKEQEEYEKSVAQGQIDLQIATNNAKLENDLEQKKQADEILKSLEPAETPLQKLTREFEEKKSILELANESTLELQSQFITASEALDQEARDKQKAKSDEDLARKKIIKEQEIALVGATFGKVAELLGKNSKVGKAFAISQALINTYQGITAELATKAATPFEFGVKLVNIASVAAIGFKAVKNIISTKADGGGGGAPSIGGGGGAGGGGAQSPSFNVVGNSGVNQIAQTLNREQAPIQAVVVANNVTTAQSANRNIVQNASLG